MELGGPEVGRGCGGRGIIHGFELLEKLGFHEWDFDYVLLDFLGDVVCGGFGLPIARDMCQKVIVVGSNDLQSLYVANNVCSAVEYFRKLGGNVGVAGMVINKDDGTGEAAAFAAAAGIPVLAAIPADEDIRRKSANYEIVGTPGGAWGAAVRAAGEQGRRGAAGAAEAADPGRAARPVQGRAVGRGVVLQAGDDGGHVRRLRRRRSRPSKWSTRAPDGSDMTYSSRIASRRRQRRARRGCRLPWRPGDDAARLRGAAGKIARRWTSYAEDYPRGPHDQPQSMCPAFGSLRVGLRMRRMATILSGSACCVYGLTFTSHFYGAKRTVGYVPFNSETLVTGKLFEDIREAVQLRQAGGLRRRRHHQSLRADGVRRAAATCCRSRSTACASSASTCPASACRPMPRPRTCWPAPCCAMRGRRPSRPGAPARGNASSAHGRADRRAVPGRSGRHRRAAGAAGPRRRRRGADAGMARPVCRAGRRRRRRGASLLHRQRSANSERPGGPSSAPARSGVEGTAEWLEAIGRPRRPAARDRRGQGAVAAGDRRPRSQPSPISGRITVSGYEGSELLVARLLVEAGAEVPYVGTACPRTEWSEADRDWLAAPACMSSTARRSSRTSRR